MFLCRVNVVNTLIAFVNYFVPNLVSIKLLIKPLFKVMTGIILI